MNKQRVLSVRATWRYVENPMPQRPNFNQNRKFNAGDFIGRDLSLVRPIASNNPNEIKSSFLLKEHQRVLILDGDIGSGNLAIRVKLDDTAKVEVKG